MFTITNVCSNSTKSVRREFKCVICGCHRHSTVSTVTVSPTSVICKNLNLSNCFCNLYDINSTVCRLDIESIFKTSSLCSKCYEEITQVEALHSQIEILKRKIQSIKLSYDSKLREFKVNSGAVGTVTVADEAKENHDKLYNYAFHCNIPATFIIPNLESEVPISLSGSTPNYLQLPGQNVESLTFDFEEASGLDCGALDTDNDLADVKSEVVSDNDENSKPVVVTSTSNEISNSVNLGALRSKYKLKNLSVRVDRVQLAKKVSTARKRRIRPKTNETPKEKRQKIKLAREARLKNFPFVCPHPECSRRYSNEIEMDGHKKGVHEGISHPFECQICNRNFKFYRNIRDHANVHTGVLTFKCQHPGCDKEYPTNDQVQDHRRRMHSPQDIVCEYCGKAFRRPLAYKEHVRIHTKELPFQCEICGKSYPVLSTLKTHRYTHPEFSDASKKCKYCGKQFTWKYYLLLHERKHTGEFRFKCDICNFTSSVESGFTRHLEKHNKPAILTSKKTKTFALKTTRPESESVKRFECDLCQRKFTRYKGLRQHKQLYHFDTGGFPCAQCGKTFGSQHHLERHEEIHKLIKKFPCTLCGKTFAQNGSRKYHMSHIHKIDTNKVNSK